MSEELIKGVIVGSFLAFLVLVYTPIFIQLPYYISIAAIGGLQLYKKYGNK